MYLYFYEAKMVIGVIPSNGEFPFAKDVDEIKFNNSFGWNSFRCFEGWETEENENGTFYMVYKIKNTKFYLENIPIEDRGSPFDVLRMFCDKQKAQKFVFDDDETIMCYNDYNTNNYKYKLHPQQTLYGDFHLSDSYYDNNGNLIDYSFENNGYAFSNKVCLTKNLPLKSYVLK